MKWLSQPRRISPLIRTFPKDNPLQEITDKATAEAESTIDKMIERLKVKAGEAVHQRNKIVIEARKALDAVKDFTDYLNVIVTDSEEVTE